MDGKIQVSRNRLGGPYLEVQLQLRITELDLVQAHVSGDILLALSMIADRAPDFVTKLWAIVAIVGAIQDQQRNPVMRLSKVDYKREE